jgi:hypothetical protein
VAQGGGVVSVFVAGGDLIDALAEQVEEGVLDAGLAARVVEAGGGSLETPRAGKVEAVPGQ